MKHILPNTSTRKKYLQFNPIIILFFILVIPVHLFSQKRIHSKSVDKNSVTSLANVFIKYDIFSVNTSEIKSYVNSNGKGFSDLEFDFEGYPVLQVTLHENDILAEDYKLILGKDAAKEFFPKPACITYSGASTNSAGSSVYLTITDQTIYGFFLQNGKQFFIEPLRYFDSNAAPSLFVMYEAADVVPFSGIGCGVTEAHKRNLPEQFRRGDNSNSITGSCRMVEVAIASDDSMLIRYQSVALLEERNISLMNLMVGIYANAQIGSQYLQFKIAGQYISTTASSNPLSPQTSGRDANVLLSNFTAWGEADNFGFNYDMAQLWTTRDIGIESPAGSGNFNSGVIGLAWVGGTCNSLRYQLLENFGGTALSTATMAAHETGHNLNAQHDAGSGFIMAAAIANPPATTFSSISLDIMNLYISGAGGSCFSACDTLPPTAQFNISTNFCSGLRAGFTDFSVGMIDSRTWSFPDGTPSTSTAINPNVTYPTAGLKSATLTVTNMSGTNTITKTFLAASMPSAGCRTSIPGNNDLTTIRSFKLANINHTASINFIGARYTDNICSDYTRLIAGATYTGKITVGYLLLPNLNFFNNYQIFIDYNGNGSFLDANEAVFTSQNCVQGGDDFTFTTPSSVPLVNTWLRLRIVAIGCSQSPVNGCNIYNNAQTEDYAVYFAEPFAPNNAITGETNACLVAGTLSTYTINGTGIASGANWSVPANASIVSGQGTNSINVQFPADFQNGSIHVLVLGVDGESQLRSLNFDASAPPLVVGEITGPSDLCQFLFGEPANYSLTAVTGANNYLWSSPANATVLLGQSTTSANILFDNNFTSGAINLTVSGCGTTPVTKTMNVTAITILSSAGSGGSMLASDGYDRVCLGANRTYTMMPDPCFEVNNVVVDGLPQGSVASYSFTNVQASHIINVTFIRKTLFVTVAAGPNGSITPGTGNLNCGSDATYHINPNMGYEIADVIIDGISFGSIGTYTFTNLTTNHTISATFVSSSTYTIISSADANGSITPIGATVVSSSANFTFTITPNACYHVLDVIVDGVSVGAVTTYSFTDVLANHSISAAFAINPALTVLVSGPVNVCRFVGSGEQITYNAISAGATGFAWILPPNVSIVSGDGTANITLVFQNGFTSQANKQLRVTALSPCGNSNLFIYYLAAQAPGTAQPITASSNNICSVIGTAGTIIYTIPSVSGASSYNWTIPANTVIGHPNNAGTANDTTVTLSFSASFTGGDIGVVASNSGCGSGGTRTLAITKNNSSIPGLISGPTNACAHMLPQGISAEYTINQVPNADNYTWTVPQGAFGLVGQGTTNISFVYPAGFVNGSILVNSSNGCGTSAARTLNISKLNSSAPGVIDVIQTGACPERTYSYTLAAIPSNSTSLQWTIPVGATLISGQGTNSITVQYPATSMSGSITVQPQNNCSLGGTRILEVKLPACPIGGPSFAKQNGSADIKQDAELNILQVFPNPSISSFHIKILTTNKQPVCAIITDVSNRELLRMNILPNNIMEFGNALKPGIFFLKVRQGNQIKTLRLVKI